MDQQRTFATDETQLDLPTTDPTATFPAPAPVPASPRDPRRARRLVAGALAAALALGVGAAVVLVGGPDATSPSAAGTRGAAGPVAERPTDSGGVPADLGAGDGPVAEPPAPAPGILAVSTNAIHLPAGVFGGSFTVRNDGGSPVDWTWAAGDFGISVDHTGGTLQPGEEVVVTFTINPFQQPVGEFLFANSIYNDDVAKDVWIHGEKKPFVVNPDIPKLDLDLKTTQ